MMGNYKFKVFTNNSVFDRVDEKLNYWLDKHPDVFIRDYQFVQTDKYQSICIRYCHCNPPVEEEE